MKILVCSDSHGDTATLNKLLREIPCDMMFHLGDCVRDCRGLREIYTHVGIRQVAGNDPGDIASGIQRDDLFMIEGVWIYMTHGHRNRVADGYDGICAAARARGAKLALFGHSHTSTLGSQGGVTYFNPGSTRAVRGGSYGLITIEDGEFQCEVRPL